MCDVSYDDVCAVWSVTRRKARKPYKCGACGAPIAIGEVYVYLFSVFDGDPQTARWCAPCHEISERFTEAHRVTPPPEDLQEMLRECVRDEPGSDAAEAWRRDLYDMEVRGKRAEVG